jgi:hypothetical protein
MHMHMTMLWRADAAMGRIDIGQKLSGRAPDVNAFRHYDNRFQL